MAGENWKIKKFYFLSSFALITIVIVFMGTYFVAGKYKEFKQQALKDKVTNVQNQKTLMKTMVDSIIQQANSYISSSEIVLQRKLRNRVQTAHQIAVSIYNDSKDTHSENEVKELIKSALSSMIYDKDYVFVIDTDGVIVSSPFLKHIEGKNRINMTDAEGNFFVRESIELVKEKGEGFKDVYWEKPGTTTKELRRKVVFMKLFEPLNWVIGYGEYKDAFEEGVKQDVIRLIESVQYGKDGYFFALTRDGFLMTFPNKGKNMYDIQDINGKYIVRDLLSASDAGGGFITYVMPAFENSRPEYKLSYVAALSKWDWTIGSGMYLTDIEQEYQNRLNILSNSAKKDILLLIVVSTLMLVLTGFIISLLSSRLQKIVDSYGKELNEMNQSLENMVEEKTAELNELNRSLEERVNEEVEKNREKDRIMFQQGRLAAMGEMIGNIAHQWRQPLSTISLLVQDIQEAFEYGELDKDYITGTVSKCTATITHMSDTIDNFRYFFNPDKKKVKFSINEEITKCLSLLDAGLENNNIRIQLNLNSESLVYGVPGEYSQVLVNIINNAKDALLSSRVENPVINISSSEEYRSVVVLICDNGGGVPEEILEKIFEPYFTTKQESKGTGIGLYFSKMIIESNMKGTLHAYNKEDGACFCVVVPIAQDENEKAGSRA